jgi:hypothetical protein
MALSGLISVRSIIAANRIAPEWIMLYVFTFGFLVTISLMLLEPNILEEKAVPLFYITLLGVLLARAFLDYVIARGFIFLKNSSLCSNASIKVSTFLRL